MAEAQIDSRCNHPLSAVRPKLRPKKSRCKTGCLCCRLRKKKCDEQRPVCSTCQRLDLPCSWLNSEEFSWRIRLGLSSSKRTPRKTKAAASSTPPESLGVLGAEDTPDPIGLESTPLCLSLPSEVDMMDSPSRRLLGLFVEKTVHQLFGAPPAIPNPFLYDLIPIAFSDSLVMNALLSVGGYPGAGTDLVEPRRLRCYGKALKELKTATAEWSFGRTRDAVRLLLTSYLLCLHECIRGNAGGSLIHHVRGSRHFAQAVLAAPSEHSYPPDLVGVVLEYYAYYEFCTSLRMLPGQDDIEAACQLSSQHLTMLHGFRTYGSVFAGFASLYQMVPFICHLASLRKLEWSQACDMGCWVTFEQLRYTIQTWSLLTDQDGTGLENGMRSENIGDFIAAGNVVRNTLLMFLHSSYYDDVDFLRDSLGPLIEETIELMTVVLGTSWINVLFWPMSVVATYTTTRSQQERILSFMTEGIPLTRRIKQTLQWVWDAPDSVYGLQGLADMGPKCKYNGSNFHPNLGELCVAHY
ncbi:Fungal specific transcription factor domain-containing protein [Cladophialophora immunda]|nr:Fungal specific transcription factor domain-containing protein [Cladophialophora immunda]